MNYLDKGINLINQIKSLGYDAYLIGGCVRDFLLNIPSNDIDITTSMPIELLKLNFDYKDNGSDYLSITIKYEGSYFEITHYRKDKEYKDHRHPIVEESDNLYDDTKRRDFTINALAFDYNKKLIDFHNGLADLENKQIRAIGDPYIRFEEDALRILRAIYFSSKLNFEIEENTLNAIKDKCYLLSCLSVDRIYEYFIKLLSTKHTNGIDYINKYDLFKYIPDFNDWLKAVKLGYSKDELVYAYYLKYNKYPVVITSAEKKLCGSLNDLIKNNFSNYSLYKNQESLYKLSKILERINVNVKSLRAKINRFPIRCDSDLALSKFEITENFEANMKSIAVNEIIKKILDRELRNDKQSILEYIEVLKDAR